MEVKFKYQILMQKKRSISQKKNNKKKLMVQKKKVCDFCGAPDKMAVFMQNALCRKYCQINISELNAINELIGSRKSSGEPPGKQYMQKYYKINYRKHEFNRIKQVYKLHHQNPRLFMPEIREIIGKCQHRKRLLQYFKIAKILGIRVQSIKFSTFLLSLTKSNNFMNRQKKSYDQLIGQISGYEFSEEVEKQLIETLSGKQNNEYLANCLENPFCQKMRDQETATSLYHRFKL